MLKEEGWTPGIVSRGYGAKALSSFCRGKSDNAERTGDEPLVLRHEPVPRGYCCPNRADAAKEYMAEKHPDVDFVISDDGMQHYALKRDIELIMLDAERGVGNGWLLPAGPLREGPWRLRGSRWVLSLYAQHPFARYVAKSKMANGIGSTMTSKVNWIKSRLITRGGIG